MNTSGGFKQFALYVAYMTSRRCPLAFIHLYKREPFKLADGAIEKGRFRLVLVAKFKDGEEVK